MAWFGSATPKPMQLFSNAPWIEELGAYRSKASSSTGRLATLHADAVTGEMRPRGNAELKSSQAYTPAFGEAVAQLWTRHRREWRSACRSDLNADACSDAVSILTSAPRDDDLWVDAALQPVLNFLRMQVGTSEPAASSHVVSRVSD